MTGPAFPRTPRDALPGATPAEDAAGGRQREKQVPCDTPLRGLGGMDSHSVASPNCQLGRFARYCWGDRTHADYPSSSVRLPCNDNDSSTHKKRLK